MCLVTYFFLLAAVAYQGCHGYSKGPPTSTCLMLFPVHGVEKQTSDPPYRLVISAATYLPGQNLTLRVESTESARPFKGFQVVAHRVSSSGNSQEFVGTFTAMDNASQTIDCLDTKRTMIAHADASPRTSVNFVWTAPDNNVGDLKFYLTVIEHKRTFWSNIPYSVQAASTDPVVPPEITVPSVTVSSSAPPDWSSCYKTKGCWLVPESHGGQCDMTSGQCLAAMSYRQDNGKFHFELSYKRGASQYFGVGFSDDRWMGDDLAIVCSGQDSYEAVGMGFNHGVNTSPHKYYFKQYTKGLSDLVVGQTTNGHTFCKFSTEETMTVLNYNVTRTYNLRDKHYLFLSWGTVHKGTAVIGNHMGAPAVSENEVDLVDYDAFTSGAAIITRSCFMLASVVLALLMH